MSLSRIIAYNVGYGDCILLHFENESQTDEKYYLLVDFGIRTTTSNQQISDIVISHRKSRDGNREALIDLVGKQIAKIVDNNKMDVLITHFHEDHYNGIYKANAFKDLKIDKIFVSRKYIPDDLKKFVDSQNIDINYLEKKDDYEIHEYPNGKVEKINILWPNKVFDNLPSRREFLEKQFPGWHKINGVNPSDGEISENDTCLVFEVKGINDKWCLFTGDASDKFNAYISNSALVEDPKSSCDLFPLLDNKYFFIKAPHHGTESWPLKAAANNCEVLITMADTRDKSPISHGYFNNKSITKIHMMNCMKGMKCNGTNGDCFKCTAIPEETIPQIIIKLKENEVA